MLTLSEFLCLIPLSCLVFQAVTKALTWTLGLLNKCAVRRGQVSLWGPEEPPNCLDIILCDMFNVVLIPTDILIKDKFNVCLFFIY